jgi:hypothetical protein
MSVFLGIMHEIYVAIDERVDAVVFPSGGKSGRKTVQS